MPHLWSLIERILGAVAVLALAALIVLPAIQVFLRDAFNSPIIGIEESTRWGLIILVFFGTPLLLATNEQIRLTEFVDRAHVAAAPGAVVIALTAVLFAVAVVVAFTVGGVDRDPA